MKIFTLIIEYNKDIENWIKGSFSNNVSLFVATDYEKIYGLEHLEIAHYHAYRRYKNNKMKASTLSMETILFAALTLQINLAIQRVGVSNTTKNIALICDCDLPNFVKKVEEYNVEITKTFLDNLSIRDCKNRKECIDTIIEKMALLELLQ
jgi:tRNA threonylcarbamoyladenosine modification (KEOPS) complex Cgi121 subunit